MAENLPVVISLLNFILNWLFCITAAFADFAKNCSDLAAASIILPGTYEIGGKTKNCTIQGSFIQLLPLCEKVI